ncbi:alpha/beta hydrolase [Paenibacillus sp. GYB003]|uniref:alpha/beta hydrolase n=1 Tax=Paenibacillus sp. GYB003 TaxID=2994392 RepID=UPI002F963BC8
MQLHTLYYDKLPADPRGVDVALPSAVRSDTALFYVHGGGWYSSSRDIYRKHLNRFAGLGYVCASAGYRTDKATRLAEKMDDVVTGYARFDAYLREHYPEVSRIVVTGSSAGAHLVSLLSLTDPSVWTSDERIAADWRKPSGCISVNGPGTLVGWPDMHPDIRASMERLVGASYDDASSEEAFRRASPDLYVSPGAPDFLFLIVGKEQFFPHRYVYEMCDKLRAAGATSDVVLYPEAAHGFFYDVVNALQKQALDEMDRFLARIENKIG